MQTDNSVYKKHIAERTETTAVAQGVMVETWKYHDEDHVFEFEHEVSADVQRRETHNCTESASRSVMSVRSRV